jgi:HEPN domain-containing protein
MNFQKTFHYWLEGAKRDMETAEVLLKGQQYSACLFWCHLTLEKILKAHIVKHTEQQSPYSHNLLLLCEKIGLSLSSEQKDQLSEINGFNLMARYPDETLEFIDKCTPGFCKKYFLITQELYQWLLQKIPSQ